MKRQMYITLIAIMAVTLSSSMATAQRSLLKQFEQEFVSLSEEIRPSVVEISVRVKHPERTDSQMEDMLKRFGIPQQPDGGGPSLPRRLPAATGTGFFYDAEGHIVTNNHVVANAEEVTVEMPDGTEVIAKVIGTDPDADIAVIKIDPEGQTFKPVKLADSDLLKVGQFAIAMGSARGQTGSISYGHISGLGREGLALPGNLRFQHFIQTDAAINLGNSGGPLCNVDGEVIGVNVAIVYDANSIGFAIPRNRVKKIVPQLILSGDVTRGWLGVSIQDITVAANRENIEVEDFLEANGLPDAEGTYVAGVTVGGPAELGGLKIDDIIRMVDGIKIGTTTDLINIVSDIEPGITVPLELWRNGKSMILDLEVGKFPGMSAARFGKAYLGMHVDELELSDDGLELLGVKESPTNFFVVEVVPGSPADIAGIKTGDIIQEVAHEEVGSLVEFKEAITENARPGKTLLLKVLQLRPDEESRKIYIKVPEDYKE